MDPSTGSENSLGAKVQSDPCQWDVEDVAQWLLDNGFHADVAELVKEQQVNGECLEELAENADSLLKELGIQQLGIRILLKKKLKKLLGHAFPGDSQRGNSTRLESVLPPDLAVAGNQLSASLLTTGCTSSLADLQTAMSRCGKLTQAAQNQLKVLSPHLHSTYQQKKRVIRMAARKEFPSRPNFAGNPLQAARLEELVKELAPSCTIPQLNFGEPGIRKHVMSSLIEWRRTRKDKNGHPLKVEVVSPAFNSESDSSNCSSSSTKTTSAAPIHAISRWNKYPDLPIQTSSVQVDREVATTQTATLATSRRGQRSKAKRLCQRGAAADYDDNDSSGSETDQEEVSSDGKADLVYSSLTQKSSRVIVCKYLNVPLAKNVLVEQHLKPLAKTLGITTQSKDKNWLIVDIAKELIKRKEVVLTCTSYKDVLPGHVKC